MLVHRCVQFINRRDTFVQWFWSYMDSHEIEISAWLIVHWSSDGLKRKRKTRIDFVMEMHKIMRNPNNCSNWRGGLAGFGQFGRRIVFASATAAQVHRSTHMVYVVHAEFEWVSLQSFIPSAQQICTGYRHTCLNSWFEIIRLKSLLIIRC